MIAQQNNEQPIDKLVFELSKLPGIGEKTASRLAYFIIKQDSSYSKSLAESILLSKKNIQFCQQCFHLTDVNPCRICNLNNRKTGSICVVEQPSDVLAIEKSQLHYGVYHVLHGVLSPLDGIGPEDLKIKELLNRLNTKTDQKNSFHEVILAMNPSVEGEATALYLARLIQPCRIKVTKIAHGLPAGGLLEFSDRQTIGKAFENRAEIKSL